MDWLNDLIIYYERSKPKQIQVDMLKEVFTNEPTRVMFVAVKTYMRECKFFPQVAELKPYVDAARIRFNDGLMRPELMNQLERDALDAEMFEWEVARGTMEPIE